jgi:hypothetical protein
MRQQLSRRPAGIAGAAATPIGGFRAVAGSVFDDATAGRTAGRTNGRTNSRVAS